MKPKPIMPEKLAMSAPDIDESDISAVIAVLRSGRLALGPKSEELERAVADYVGARHAVAVSSGTAALHVIVKALGIGPGDEVLVPSFTFAGSVNALLYEGATPVFVEIESETYNLDPSDLEARITPRTKAIMAVDVFGHPCEWDEILRVAGRHGLKVIGDSCEALGSEYRGRRVGALGDASAFAFYPNKQITTGEGGIVVTNRDDVYNDCRSLRNQGRGEMSAWLEHDRLGYNYRMDEMSAALGVSQMKRIEHFLTKREAVAQRYDRRLAELACVSVPHRKPGVRMSRFVYVITLTKGSDRDLVMRRMDEQGISVRGYFSPVHLQPYIRERFGYRGGELPVTESVAKRTIALPFHNNLREAEIERVVSALRRSC
ncbi:MAG TPA: DegT/DnrJ/EryC1/StrS family aminotransferase [Blastocatellia bacterium]|nr:DegT/DnrJ/EryC1/StrS family aminotransferase [Blastocatellia bacterium]